MTQHQQLLDKLFKDPKTGFVGEQKLFHRARQIESSITRKQVRDYLQHNSIHQVFQKPKQNKEQPKKHGKVGHYQADLTFLTRYKKQNSNYHILLKVINVNTKYAYIEGFKDKLHHTISQRLEAIRKRSLPRWKTTQSPPNG